MHLVYPPKFCITVFFQFLLGIIVVRREIEDNGYAKLEGGGGGKGVNKVHYDICENGEWLTRV